MRGSVSSGAGLLILLAIILVVDPVYSYVRRRLNTDYPRYTPPRKTFRVLAFAVPALALLSASEFILPRRDQEGGYLFLVAWFCIGCFIGKYYFDRARDRGAYLLGAKHVEPDDPELGNDLYDLLAIAFGVLLVFLPLVLSRIMI